MLPPGFSFKLISDFKECFPSAQCREHRADGKRERGGEEGGSLSPLTQRMTRMGAKKRGRGDSRAGATPHKTRNLAPTTTHSASRKRKTTRGRPCRAGRTAEKTAYAKQTSKQEEKNNAAHPIGHAALYVRLQVLIGSLALRKRNLPKIYFFAAFLRSTAESRRLRRRMDCGVTSTNSSSSMYSSASSSVKVIGGVS